MREKNVAEQFLSAPIETVDVGTAEIAFRRFGEGEPVLLIHGWPLNGFTWRKILPQLSARYTCYVVDLAGAGETEWSKDNDFSFHGHALNLQQFARKLRLDRYRLIAHDTGATVARRLAVIEGPRVTQGVYIDTEIPHHRPPMVQVFQAMAGLPGMGLLFRRLMRSRRFLHSGAGFGGCFVDRSLIDGDFTDQFITPLVESAERMDGQMRYVRGIDWNQLDGLAKGHGEITGSTLLIWGERDPFFPVARAREMVGQFRECRGFVVIPKTRLLPHEERPEVVVDHIVRFFAGPAQRPPRITPTASV